MAQINSRSHGKITVPCWGRQDLVEARDLRAAEAEASKPPTVSEVQTSGYRKRGRGRR